MVFAKFKEVAASVLMVLGLPSFKKDNDGKSFLSDEEKKLLTEKFGEKFTTAFLADLQESEAKGESFDELLDAQMKLRLEAQNAELIKLREQNTQLKKAQDDLQATIAKLEKQPAGSGGHQVTVSEVEKAAIAAGVDLSLKHNRFLVDYMSGKVQAAYSGDSTIDTQELKTEFGKYVDNNRLEIMRGLFGQTESTKYMSSIITDKTEVRAVQANIIGTVLQQFVPEWTPSGKAKFTPLTIKNFKCKLNVPIKPSDIMEDILGYMYDEQATTLQSMPIVRYILQQLIFPKLDEEREDALAVGRYKESQPDGNGKYTASAPSESMDGYLTQLVDYYNADAAAQEGEAKSGIRWLSLNTDIATVYPTPTGIDTIMDFIDNIVDEIAQKYPLYARKKMFVHCDPNLILEYQRAYREKYPMLKNEDGDNRTKIDFSKFTFAPMEGMRGTCCFFITPTENFKHLMSHNPQNVTLRFLENHYSVDVMAEWWEGTGFWLAEALFAYIAPAAAVTYAKPSANAGGNGEGGGL